MWVFFKKRNKKQNINLKINSPEWKPTNNQFRAFERISSFQLFLAMNHAFQMYIQTNQRLQGKTWIPVDLNMHAASTKGKTCIQFHSLNNRSREKTALGFRVYVPNKMKECIPANKSMKAKRPSPARFAVWRPCWIVIFLRVSWTRIGTNPATQRTNNADQCMH